jgi:peptidoglycan hydrolase-like protein with peptidoglycan-binding domain
MGPRSWQRFLAWFLCALSVCAKASEVTPSRRALVIGNGAYEGDLALRNPVNDATDVAESLKAVGFVVDVRSDLSRTAMEDALVEFRRSLQAGDVALFFYAGHGLEVDGSNYLVPIGARIRESFEVKREALDVTNILDAMKDSGAKLNVLVLDCCRDNPLKRSWAGRSASARNGLASINAPEGTLIAYSTAPGSVAADGNPSARNSPYSAALIKALRDRSPEGLELKEVFFSASREVKRSTGQTPWISLEASLEPYFLIGGSAEYEVVAPPPAPAEPIQEPVPPQPAAAPPSLAEIFDGTGYDLYNDSSKRAIVKKAEEKLKNAGVFTGKPDGEPGADLQAAILEWQRARGIVKSGLLDGPTLISLAMDGIAEEPAKRENSAPQPKSSASPNRQAKSTAGAASKPKPASSDPVRQGIEKQYRRGQITREEYQNAIKNL